MLGLDCQGLSGRITAYSSVTPLLALARRLPLNPLLASSFTVVVEGGAFPVSAAILPSLRDRGF